jgi:hypothetical protein
VSQPSAEAKALHATLDGDGEELTSTLDRFTDHELWTFQDACITLTRTISAVLHDRIVGVRERPDLSPGSTVVPDGR